MEGNDGEMSYRVERVCGRDAKKGNERNGKGAQKDGEAIEDGESREESRGETREKERKGRDRIEK